MHQLLTSVLDLLGLLLLVAAAAVFVSEWSSPGALATAGVGLLLGSWLLDRARGGWRRKR